jgi:hypothetical protein
MEFYCLPDHTRTLCLHITDSKGKALVSKVVCDDVNTHRFTTFRKSGVMLLQSHEWVEMPPGEYSVVVSASTMVMHKKTHEPSWHDREAFTGGFPAGYL